MCKSAPVGRASLREDYLNQVQRDFLSLGIKTSAPPADLSFNKNPYYAFKQFASWLYTQQSV